MTLRLSQRIGFSGSSMTNLSTTSPSNSAPSSPVSSPSNVSTPSSRSSSKHRRFSLNGLNLRFEDSPKSSLSKSDSVLHVARSADFISLHIDHDFVETALILVPESLQDFEPAQLALFIQAVREMGSTCRVSTGMFVLGKSLYIFPENSIKEQFRWVFYTDNKLGHNLFRLLEVIAMSDCSFGLSETIFSLEL